MKLRQILKQLNLDGKQVFSVLQKKGPLTKNDILEQLSINNFTSLNRIMEPLEKENLIIEVGIGDSSGGRKPVIYDLNFKRFFLLGIDISRPYTEIVITDPKMNILNVKSFNMDKTFTPQKTVQTITALFEEGLNQLGISKEQFLGVGLGTVGPLSRSVGTMIRPKNFASHGWIGAPIKNLIEDALSLPVLIDNGANTAILAEYYYGVGKGYENIAYFNCSTGIRTGAITDGTIIRTINDAEDAFGHMVINVDGESCSCGNYGCIDCYSSIYAIRQNFIAALKQGRTTNIVKSIDTINYDDICQAAAEYDPLAREIITNAATILGVGLANYINLLNPGLVILSGPMISQSELFYEIASETAAKKLYMDSHPVDFNRGGRFENDAIAIGAAAMVVESYL